MCGVPCTAVVALSEAEAAEAPLMGWSHELLAAPARGSFSGAGERNMVSSSGSGSSPCMRSSWAVGDGTAVGG